MRAIIAMAQAPDITDPLSGIARGPGLIERAREVFSICSRAADAAHAYEALKAMSGDELAKRGLKRADLPRAAYDKLAGKS